MFLGKVSFLNLFHLELLGLLETRDDNFDHTLTTETAS